MNQAHLHLIVNHLPIVGLLLGILILVAGMLLKNNTVKKTALGVFVFAALCAIPAYLTGEGAEETVENLAGVGEDMMETHEELANIFLWIAIALGGLALFTFWTDRAQKKSASTLYVLTLIAALGAMVFAQRVGTSGGNIRHTEIRSDVIAPNSGQGEAEKDDD